jgi:hypothetical protein
MATHRRHKLFTPNPNKTMLFRVEPLRMQAMFFHLPKTGGQSIYEAFGRKPQTHSPLSHPARQHELEQADFAFAFVRHPFDRAVSFFHWVSTLHKEWRKGRRAEHYALNILSRDMEVNDFYRKFDFAYWEFCSFMLRPQSWMLLNPQTEALDARVRLYEFELFAAEFNRLCLDMGFKLTDIPKLPHVNSTGGRKWENELEDDVIEKLAEYYRMDFELLPFYEQP